MPSITFKGSALAGFSTKGLRREGHYGLSQDVAKSGQVPKISNNFVKILI